MVYVTHDQIEAMTMADRIVALRDGELMQVGSPLELYDEPSNTFIAQFIGSPSMNIFAGRIEDGFFHGPGGCTFKLFGRAARATACDVHLGVRPEFLDIVSPESDGIPGEIVLVEPTGTDVSLTVDTPVGSLVVLNREGLSEGLEEGMKRERREYRPGEKLFLQPQQVRLFDPETGVRL